MRKAVVIIESDAELKSMWDKYDADCEAWSKEDDALHKKKLEIRENFWNPFKAILVEKGLLSSTDIALEYDDGVIYDRGKLEDQTFPKQVEELINYFKNRGATKVEVGVTMQEERNDE